MEVTNATICKGITRAARQLGVSYNHLWKVLTGRYDSPSLVMKINDRCPSVFRAALCKIKFKSIIAKCKGKYEWDAMKERYIKVRRNTK